MNRPIKFRAWDKEGNCFYYSSGQPNVDFIFGKMGDGVYIGGLLRIDLTDENTNQFTGLKDKSGVEIYEGDILSVKIRGSRRVLPGEVAQHLSGTWIVGEGGDLWHFNKRCEVIGNFYENPELLTKEVK
ncbi:hypothetical protein B5P43_18385 [Bacillus sp. SRB_336]|nr:hypothetical protein B5P43_18385 [Bacillus sp. SRB_336]